MTSQAFSVAEAARHSVYLSDVTPDIARMRTVMVNLYFVGEPRGDWVLVDTGIPFFANRIMRAAAERFGPNSRPKAIVLTHGHFDHAGNVIKLAEQWDVPVYAHTLELPYLTGRSDYPPADPTVGGGLMARSAFLYPRRGIDLGQRVQALPDDASVPFMPGWQWVHTPGHTPGHVSLFREADSVLLAGDAFITQNQQSLRGVLSEKPVLEGPPTYFTTDWAAASVSVQRLAAMQPALAATGHGMPMGGDELTEQLHWLIRNFESLAVPMDGRYVREPARADATGVVSVPPAIPDPTTKIAIGAAAAVVALAFLRRRR